MLPGAIPSPAKKEERRLIKLYKQLGQNDRSALLSFAEFLVSREDSVDQPASEMNQSSRQSPVEPKPIPRPEKETVIKAIKRLRMTYPMVDKETVLHPISGLMSQHIMQGKEAYQVIDDLELLFSTQYETLKETFVNEDGQNFEISDSTQHSETAVAPRKQNNNDQKNN